MKNFKSFQKFFEQLIDTSNMSLNQKRELEGRRVRCLSMTDDPDPIPPGMLGTITGVDSMGSLLVQWDNGRSLNMLCNKKIGDKDECELIPRDSSEEVADANMFD